MNLMIEVVHTLILIRCNFWADNPNLFTPIFEVASGLQVWFFQFLSFSKYKNTNDILPRRIEQGMRPRLMPTMLADSSVRKPTQPSKITWDRWKVSEIIHQLLLKIWNKARRSRGQFNETYMDNVFGADVPENRNNIRPPKWGLRKSEPATTQPSLSPHRNG